MPLKMRTVVRDRLFEADVREIEPDVRRADEYLEAVERVLSRKPDCGYRIGNSHVWFTSAHTLPLIVYYTFDEERVFLLSIQKTLVLEK